MNLVATKRRSPTNRISRMPPDSSDIAQPLTFAQLTVDASELRIWILNEINSDSETHGASEFEDLAARWKSDTAHISSVHDIVLHDAYQRIIGMGQRALRYILRDLKASPNHWFWALRAITGEDPVPNSARGNISDMASAWVMWGQQRGLLS